MEELIKKIDEMDRKLLKIDMKISDVTLRKIPFSEKEKMHRKLQEERSKINKIKEIYRHQLFSYEHEKTCTDDIIDLYMENYRSSDKYHYYSIFLCDTHDFVGEINYFGRIKEPKKFTYGDISYYIMPEYRGKNFALKALSLMAQELTKENIENIYLSAKKDNIASIKTIEKFGGEIFDTSYDSISYICDLKELLNSKKYKIK